MFGVKTYFTEEKLLNTIQKLFELMREDGINKDEVWTDIKYFVEKLDMLRMQGLEQIDV